MMPLSLLGCLMSSSGRLWTPADFSVTPNFFFVAPKYGRQDRLTVSAGKVTDVADYAGGSVVLSQATAGRRPAWNNANVIDGYTSITLLWNALRSGSSQLISATGGPSGAVDHHLLAVFKLTGTPNLYQASNQSVVSVGPASGQNSVLGVEQTGGGDLWAGGGPDHGTPVGNGAALRAEFAAGRYVLAEKTYAAGSSTAKTFLNGVLGANGTVSLAPADGTIQLGGDWIAFDSYSNPNAELIMAGVFPAILPLDDLLEFDTWRHREMPTAFPIQNIDVGDSRVVGVGQGGVSLESETWRYQLAAAMGRREFMHAKVSATMDDIINGLSPMPSLAVDLARDTGHGAFQAHLVEDGSINDFIFGSDTPTTIFNKKAAVWAAARAAGISKVYTQTVYKSTLVSGGRETDRQSLETMLINAVGTLTDGHISLEAIIPNAADTGVLPDGTHPSPTTHTAIAAASQAVMT